MKDWPQPFWALMFAVLGAIVALATILSGGPENIRLAVVAIAGSLVTGALGYAGGHVTGQKSNPTLPKDAAESKEQ